MQKQYSPQDTTASYNNPLYLRQIKARRQMHFHWDSPFSRGQRGRRTEGKEVDRYWVEGWVKQDDEQASCNVWTFDYGNIECENDLFIRCGFEGETGGAGEQGSSRKAVISVNLTAKRRVWHVVSVWSIQRDMFPLHLLCALWSCPQTVCSDKYGNIWRVRHVWTAWLQISWKWHKNERDGEGRKVSLSFS